MTFPPEHSDDKTFGFCSPCQWWTHAINDEHNEGLTRITGTLQLLEDLIEAATKDPESQATHELATTIMARCEPDKNA
tara:strand:+ start:654 stop:887 length:234 start_codon:yes stop_codon:yes gene_type:complete